MFKRCKAFIIMLFVAICFTLPVNAADTTKINDLVENAMVLDGKTVIVTGEAIGEVLERGKYAWVNIHDGSNAIGIWMKIEDAKKITYFGDYRNIGDTVIITGTFSRACTEHGGDVDIHCSNLEIMNKGHVSKEELSASKVVFAAASLFVTSLLAVLYFKLMKKPAQE